MSITSALFGHTRRGTPVTAYQMRTSSGACAVILDYGATIQSLCVPDRDGNPVDVVLGYDTLEEYEANDGYLGATIGRFANRIAGGTFFLNGQEYRLAKNDGANHLHGGVCGFDKQLWQIKSLTDSSLCLTLTSPDGQEGYPGELTAEVTYTLQDRSLELRYTASSTRTTLCNLTNHAYFNLSGHRSGPISGQHFQLLASRYTPVDSSLIPTGALAPVEGTGMDLRALQPLGERTYDHNWAVSDWDGSLRPAARAWSPDTGISLEVLTTLPGVQFYTGNFLDGCPRGKEGAPYAKGWAFCLETQYFPDSPNHPAFPSAALAPGAVYESRTVYRFGAGAGQPFQS